LSIPAVANSTSVWSFALQQDDAHRRLVALAHHVGLEPVDVEVHLPQRLGAPQLCLMIEFEVVDDRELTLAKRPRAQGASWS
jgi:hypothetical protein